MSANILSKEVEIRLMDFFANSIDPKDLAKKIRRLNYLIGFSTMRKCEATKAEIKALDDNFYWLNELAQVLDPYLDVE